MNGDRALAAIVPVSPAKRGRQVSREPDSSKQAPNQLKVPI